MRSFKIRGTFNKIDKMGQVDRDKGVVYASAGNHAQGLTYICKSLSVNGDIFVPTTTPKQKISRVEYFGGDRRRLHLGGSEFNETLNMAKEYASYNDKVFVHPYDDNDIIEGQGTMAIEIDQQLEKNS